MAELNKDVHILGLRIVFRPDPLELIQMMRAQNRPIACQIVKVVHDDGDEQVDNLREHKHAVPT